MAVTEERLAIATLWFVLGVAGCASQPDTWYRIPGARVTPWAQTQATCGPLLQRGQSTVIAGGGAPAVVAAKAQYRECMGRNGWTDSPVSTANDPHTAALHRDGEGLHAKIKASRTKNALTLATGESPQCQPGDPGTEICNWHWTRSVDGETVPLKMTCVLPRDGAPRAEDSCRWGRDTAR